MNPKNTDFEARVCNQAGDYMGKTKKSVGIWATLTIAIIFAAISAPGHLSASLGGDVTSVENDRAKMEASLQRTSTARYAVHEMHAPNNLVVREYVSPAGNVFGVAWQGPSRPDLRQVLGTYFDSFNKAAQGRKSQRAARGPVVMEQDGMVIEMGGHARSFYGRAYVPQSVPSGVQLEEIR
jgi:hypothetical protein